MRDIFEAPPTGRASRAPRAGFTLVEVLMVILIISMLIALLLPAVNAAKLSATKASIKIDVDQLVTALNAFKAKYGSYPPDRNWTDNEYATFLRRAFPRYNPQTANGILDTVAQCKLLDEAESLVFWLGGRWDGAHLTGFPADPNPTSLFVAGGQRTTSFLQFTETRLKDRNSNNFPEYYPPNINIDQAPPYVYFAAHPNGKYWKEQADGTPTNNPPQYQPLNMNTIAVPYHFNTVDDYTDKSRSTWVNPSGFQLICAGVDNDYGANANKVFPLGTAYATTDLDNIVNFTDRTIGDAKP